MKKILMITALTMVLGAGIATAATLAVPFFADNAGTTIPGTGGIPTSAGGPGGIWVAGNNTLNAFIAVKNCGTASTIVSVRYWDFNGNEMTPTPPSNTFWLSANQGVGFRPIVSDPIAEASGTIVPKMVNGTSVWAGSATLEASGVISGRMLSNSPNGARFAYLLDRLP